MCDNECIEEGFKFFQLAAIVTAEGGAAHTINLCKKCYNERQKKRGDQPVKAARWRELMEQKVFRWKLWVAFGMEQSWAKNVGTSHRHQV